MYQTFHYFAIVEILFDDFSSNFDFLYRILAESTDERGNLESYDVTKILEI